MSFIPERRKKIGEIFLAMGLATEDDVKMALSYQQKHPDNRLGEVLSDAGVINNEDIAIALAKQFKLQYINLNKFILDPKLTVELTEELIADLYFVPLKKLGGNVIIAIDDPTDQKRIEQITQKIPGNVTFVVSSSSSISKLLTDIIYKVKTKTTIKREKKKAAEKEATITKKITPPKDGAAVEEVKEKVQAPVQENIIPKMDPLSIKKMDSMLEDFNEDEKVFDQFLEKLKELAVPVQIFLATGTTLQGGIIIAFDDEAIYLKEKKKCQLILRNSIVGMSFVEPLS
ncbi:RNA chaperone Hfq [bacterium]|nr:RNA chaperone Hfq [bacterium]